MTEVQDQGLVILERPTPAVAIITLNNPDRLNALSFRMVDAIHDALDEIQADNACRVVILTGSGRGFCSGLDLSSVEGSSTSAGTTGPRAGMLSQERIAELPIKLRRLQQPVIAAVNGVAYGGGFALSLACDLRVAAPGARFCAQFIKLGIGGCDIGISYTLPRAVGSSRAFDLLLTARTVQAEEALDMGIVSALADDPVAHALELAELICTYSPFGVVMTKEVMWSNLDAVSIEQAVHLENRTQILASTGGEMAEAATAFMEKRPPDWSKVRPSGVWAR
ncbi:enoyl-CoA hydratase/isomerase family protein [Dermatobacter hominis]|uniref:enoyl-CoA hydratase/isomerase family protein n=1 Tax=Dermatobacter hominis TaxID=2884263 RepID=UPI001D11C57B|nr:enoyl-CoA hydratase-related protein [Dermatobacter hominis]UDY34899.1 enoyl-CoA hydratase/isomerase family protein [Dermatobacter hominis]